MGHFLSGLLCGVIAMSFVAVGCYQVGVMRGWDFCERNHPNGWIPAAAKTRRTP